MFLHYFLFPLNIFLFLFIISVFSFFIRISFLKPPWIFQLRFCLGFPAAFLFWISDCIFALDFRLRFCFGFPAVFRFLRQRYVTHSLSFLCFRQFPLKFRQTTKNYYIHGWYFDEFPPFHRRNLSPKRLQAGKGRIFMDAQANMAGNETIKILRNQHEQHSI